MHGVLGVASFVPGLSVVTGSLDAAIYLAEGNVVEAGIAAVSILPGGKIATTAGKVVKGAVGLVKEAKVVSAVAKTANVGDDVINGDHKWGQTPLFFAYLMESDPIYVC